MIESLCVMAAGAIGALSRWGTDKAFKHYLGTGFPYGTLCVNLLGCLLFGIFMQLDSQMNGVSKYVKLLITSGFLGAFTTFSTFGYDTFHFIRTGNMLNAVINVSANLIFGLLAVWGGTLLVKAFS